ncbi:MAG: TRAP transporter substrate-binding protein [Deltaproteobacteria bacterium]|nr:TRAP transporter substrate-binding protein [Deltaproteobacteria bacterium]
MARRTTWAGCALIALTLAPESSHADAPVIVKIGTVAPEDTPWAKQAYRVKRQLEHGSKRRLKVKVYLSAILGDEVSLVRQCRDGDIQVVGTSTGAFAAEIPEIGLLELPYLFLSQREADTVLDEMFDDFAALFRERGFILAYWTENGWRSFATKDRAIRSAADLAGLRMRAQESPVHVDLYKELGAIPRAIGVGEVLSSIQTGIVDGFDNTPLFTFATSWYQGIRHFTLTEHMYQPAMVVYSKKFVDSLPPALVPMLTAHRKRENAWARRGVRELTPALLRNFQRTGITVTRLTAAERAALARAMRPVHDRYRASVGPRGVALYDKVETILRRLRKSAR